MSSYVVNLKIARFVFDQPEGAGRTVNPPGSSSSTSGRHFSVRWLRCSPPEPLGHTRWSRAIDLSSGGTGGQGPSVDFLGVQSTFVVDSAALAQSHTRVVLFHLMSRDSSFAGHSSSVEAPSQRTSSTGGDGGGTLPVGGDVNVVGSGTVDLNAFVGVNARSYAVALEHSFIAIGKLHFNAYVTTNTRVLRPVQEHTMVIHIDQVVDEWFRRHPDATTAYRRSDAGTTGGDTSVPALFDAMHFTMRLDMDGAHRRGAVAVAGKGRVRFRESIPMEPAKRVRFTLYNDKTALAVATVKVERLMERPVPQEFALPLKPAQQDRAGHHRPDLTLHFAVREELVTREVAPVSRTSPVARQSPTLSTRSVGNGSLSGRQSQASGGNRTNPPTPAVHAGSTGGQGPSSPHQTSSSSRPPSSFTKDRAASPPAGLPPLRVPSDDENESATTDRRGTNSRSSSSSSRGSDGGTSHGRRGVIDKDCLNSPLDASRTLRGDNGRPSSSLATMPRRGTRSEVAASEDASRDSASVAAPPMGPPQTSAVATTTVGSHHDKGTAGGGLTYESLAGVNEDLLRRRIEVLEQMLVEAHDTIYMQDHTIQQLRDELRAGAASTMGPQLAGVRGGYG